MDPSLYKDVKTTRGLNYHYFVSPAQNSKPTILFLHGFPSSSYDWHYQVAYFVKEGYGVVVPDMLGYGGTDKPTDVLAYTIKNISADVIDILDAEKIDRVIAVGHDWGSFAVSRLANYYPERFLAFGFLAVPYFPPAKNGPTIAQLNAATKAMVGYELFGYQIWFSQDGTDKIIESNLYSFISILFPHDPRLWVTDLAPIGAAEKWVTSGKTLPPPPYLTEAERDKHAEPLKKNGFAGCLNWYKVSVDGHVAADDQLIPEERYDIQQPVFFGAALKDYICLAPPAKAGITKHCKNATVKDFDTDHWLLLAAPDQLNKDLHEWIQSL